MFENVETIVDVESSAGELALYYAGRFETATIYAFESDPKKYVELSKNVASSGASNVTIFNNSLVDSVEEKTGLLTIDSLGLTSCSVISLGRRSKHREAIEGARSTIERHRPMLILESDDSIDAPEGYELDVSYRERGLRAYRWVESKLEHSDRCA